MSLILFLNYSEVMDRCNPKIMIVYKKTDEWYIEWQRVTTSDNEWYNEWQRMTTSDNEWYNKWQIVTASNTTRDNEWQQMAVSDSEWQQWYNEWKRHSALQRTDDCPAFQWQKQIHYYFKWWMTAVRMVK